MRTLVTLLLLTITSACAPAAPPTEPPKTEILWDTWGVPHIYAVDDQALFRAFGYAQAESHGNLILRLYGQARGLAAEYWGEQYLHDDRWVGTMGVPGRAKDWYEAQSAAFKRNLDAFADGINAYATEHPDRVESTMRIVLPISAVDVLAHTQRIVHFNFVSSPEQASLARRELATLRGSNAWAIGPRRSASGHAMLLANPHLPWSDFWLFYEAHVMAPGVDVYGATLVGFPVLAIAFNDRLGWSHTVNTIDASDPYVLTLTGDGYAWNGGVRRFETASEIIKVRQNDGSLRDEPLTIRRSEHGPVVTAEGKRAVALRVAGLDQPRMLEEWWQTGRARNLAEFETALSGLQIPMFNVVYADRDGHILYLFGGRVPDRPAGRFDTWSGLVPGQTERALWTRTLPYEKLPRVVDPPTGWLQNANDPPWTSTIPVALNPMRYPPYLSPRFMHFRAQRSARMIQEDESITFDELVAYKHSTRSELADRLLDELVAAARREAGPLTRKAADVLSAWDRQTDASSRGALLFEAWAQIAALGDTEIEGRLPGFATQWNPDDPLATPTGLANPSVAVSALQSAAGEVQKAFGALDVAWGDVHRLRYGGKDLPGNGAPGDPLGVFRAAYYGPDQDGRFRIVAGDSYVAAIAFETPVRAQALLSYGNATQPGSPHVGDQLDLFARKALRPIWRARGEVVQHLERRDIIP